MSDASFPTVFLGRLRYWSLHCLLNALPSLGIAMGWIGLWKYPEAVAAMSTAISTFILLYATFTSLKGPLSDERHVLHRAMKIGTKIRSRISGAAGLPSRFSITRVKYGAPGTIFSPPKSVARLPDPARCM